MNRSYNLIVLALFALTVHAEKRDSLCHWGAAVDYTYGSALVIDKYQRLWQKGTSNSAVDFRLIRATMPSDDDDFAADYGYPTLAIGAKWSFNHGVTTHKDKEFWGEKQAALKEVDYDSKMGNIISLYGRFTRPFYRSNRWEFDYSLDLGVGWSHHKYNKENAIDNELIGSRWLIYIGGGLHATYHIAKDWGVMLGVDYYHHSNGAMNRPNKGANIFGPTAGLVYQPYYEQSIPQHPIVRKPFDKHFFLNVAAAVGMRTIMEEWQITQFQTNPDQPDYRTDHFDHYVTYAFNADLMYRYARRWASGVGVDLFYDTYCDRVEEIARQRGDDSHISPVSVGISAKHEAFFGPLSFQGSVGYYLYRHMGKWAVDLEGNIYERVGVSYQFRGLGGLKLGFAVKAHETKADHTELVISYPTTIFNRKTRKNSK